MLPTFGQLYDDPRMATALNSAVERGVNVTVAVHNYMAAVLTELGKAGKIKLVYVPQMPEEDVLAVKGGQNRAVFSQDRDYRVSENPQVVDRLTEKLQGMEQYPIPPEKVERFADMINRERGTSDIVAYLME